MFNPRFPHTFRVWRVRKNDFGEPVTNDEGDPVYDIVRVQAAVVIDDKPVRLSNGSFDTELTEWVNFGYRTQGKNTRETVDVIVSDYKLACAPLMTYIEPGDRLEIKDYMRTYWGDVVKMMTFNLGSNIWINEVKN
jgi:hypothetical protein